jgi:hypothetical protein
MKLLTIILSIIFLSCNTTKKMETERPIDVFQKVITGNFDNSKQVAEEVATGKQIHPLARHVNRMIDHKIDGLPNPRVKSDFWILEESYYEYPNKPVEVKPYLFHFKKGANNTIILEVYQFPERLKKEEIKNDNDNLRLQLNELKPSPTFKGATYHYDATKKIFTTNAVNELGNGVTFTLTEILSLTQLVVMELIEKNGQRITPYTTPIIYDRK